MSGKSKLSRSFPARVKGDSKSRSPLHFKRFADFLTLKRKKKKPDDASSSLEKQPWFHGKINAEYAELLIKKSGEFLVREDPAMPGDWFIAVRAKDIPLHLAINKLKSSKGTRFKYRIEDSDFVFDSISELIRFYVNERRPVCIRPPAVITIAVSREQVLLSEEDFRGRFATAGSARLSRTSKKLERKSSDPNLSTRVPSRLYEEIDDPSSESRYGTKPERPKMAVNGSTPLKSDNRKNSADRTIQTSTRSRSMDNVLDDSAIGWEQHTTYDSPKSPTVSTSPSFKTPFTQQEKKRKNLDPSMLECDADYATPSSIPADQEYQVPSTVTYDTPRTSESDGLTHHEENNTKPVNDDSKSVEIESKHNAQDERHNLYLTVLSKLCDTLVEPILSHDCVTLARHLTKADLEVVWREAYIKDDDGGALGLEKLVLPQGREKRCALLDRYQQLTYWTGALVIAAGEMSARAKMISKLIALADALSEKLGNLLSFMAIIDGLALAQVTRLHHTWSCLHHQFSSSAVVIHSTLKPLAGLLSSGAPSPYPGVCLPYVIPLAKLLESTNESNLDELTEHDGEHQGIDMVLTHLDTGRTLIQQVDAFRSEADSRLAFGGEDETLTEYFRDGIDVSKVLGVQADSSSRTHKLNTLLSWLSENIEQGNAQ